MKRDPVFHSCISCAELKQSLTYSIFLTISARFNKSCFPWMTESGRNCVRISTVTVSFCIMVLGQSVTSLLKILIVNIKSGQNLQATGPARSTSFLPETGQ
jgi:hypothetical protein